MTDSSDKMQQFVLGELQKRRARPAANLNRARVLGAFVQAALDEMGRTRHEFARALDIEDEPADALLDGELPEALLSDETLAEIARVIDFEPNVLRAMLGRSITPAHQEDQASNST